MDSLLIRVCSDLIREHFRVSYHFNHELAAPVVLQLAATCASSEERDEEAIARWREQGLAADQKNGRRRQATIVFSTKRALCFNP